MYSLEYALFFGVPDNKIELLEGGSRWAFPFAGREEGEAHFNAWLETLRRRKPSMFSSYMLSMSCATDSKQAIPSRRSFSRAMRSTLTNYSKRNPSVTGRKNAPSKSRRQSRSGCCRLISKPAWSIFST